MIFYVVTEREKEYRQGKVWHELSRRLEEHAGDHCLIVHYKQLNRALIEKHRPWALCHSGGSVGYDEYDVLKYRPYQELVHNYPGAQIGFCGGHQILANFFGSTIGPMRKLRPGEPDLGGYGPGQFKEWGVYPVRIVKSDPLFKGLGRMIRVQEFHAWEVRKLSPRLKLLASTQGCRVQAYVHREKPIYGVQFHPEQSPKAYPDGNTVLDNFFRIARSVQNGH